MRTAIVYDRVNKWGGAERVLLALNEIFPSAPLYCGVYHPEKAKWAKVFPKVIPSFLNKLPYLRDKHEVLGTFMPIAFESIDFNGFDLVISVTSEAAKGIIVRPQTRHICYCLTPTRYLWSHYKTYFKGESFKGVSRPFVSYLRKWDEIAAQRPDSIIAISSAVQARIRKYYSRESSVVYPPVDLDRFKVSKVPKVSKADFYLIVSRLVPYKKVDLAVEVFNELRYPLVIIGTGSEEKRLKRMAKGNIQFKGHLTDKELAGYYQKARAFIFPQEEDFGITAVEAQAAGTPVIAFKAGGALDTVIDGKTGVFFERQDKDSLIQAVKKFDKIHFNHKNLTENAKRFSKDKFKIKLMTLLEKQV